MSAIGADKMRRLLIVSPSFPPTSAADLHRVRLSLPHFASFGWSPQVLAIDPAAHGGLLEPGLEATIPRETVVTRTSALPESVTRALGIANPGLRALLHLYSAGSRLLTRESFDLVYFSTTMFPVMSLGRMWKARFGVPYVLDIQDPWKSDYQGAGRRKGMKASAARLLHGLLEPFAMRKVGGIVAVSPAYVDNLRKRYPWITPERSSVVPFGTSAADFETASHMSWTNPFFAPASATVHAVAVGRGGRDMAPAAELLFGAVRMLQERNVKIPDLHLWFVGTDYSSGGERTIAPVADLYGVGSIVTESPQRMPYLQALRLLQDASMTVMLGSDDAAYSPSKVYPYLLAGKPFLAIMHEDCPVIPLLRSAKSGVVATFRPGRDNMLESAKLADGLRRLLTSGPTGMNLPAELLESVSARELTRRQCEAFDAVVRRESSRAV